MDNKSGSGRLDSGEPTSTSPATVTANGGIVPDSYKQLPDDDVNWQSKNNKANSGEDLKLKDMGKQNGTEGGDDEAQERMLKEDNAKPSVVPSKDKDATEVKFIPENGDAKIDIETVKQSLSGMGKSELMKYANDPFWIKLRWFLFIAFWVLWIAMLVGAIAIIVMAPKCAAPSPKKWFEESPIVKLSSSDLKHPLKDPNSLETLLNSLKQQNIEGISLQSILKESPRSHVVDFQELNDDVGSIDDFKKFVGAAKDKSINVIIELDPNHSSDQHEWFKKSINREEPFTSFYVWADASKSGGPPNNWLSINGGSAWEYNSERKQYYLHQFNKTQPDFNFTNPDLMNKFSDIFEKWLGVGVKGFRLSNTRLLVEDPNLYNDQVDVNHFPESGLYQSLIHNSTRDQPQNSDVLRKWRRTVLEHPNGSIFTLSDELSPEILRMHNTPQESIIDVPQTTNSKGLAKTIATHTATELKEKISSILSETSWPTIDLNAEGINLRDRIKTEEADSAILMTMLLPATPILKLNDLKINDTKYKDAFTAITKARAGPSFLYGTTKTHVLNNGTVFAYTRVKSGNPGYLILYNTGYQDTTVDLSVLSNVSEEVNIVAYSPNYNDQLNESQKLASNKVPLSSKSTLVVTFVSKTK